MNHNQQRKSSYFLDEFSQKDKKKYVIFAKKNFGSFSYQHKNLYLDYLYNNAPHSSGYEDLTIIKHNSSEEIIVGCLHRIKVQLVHSSKNNIKEISSLHNLMIDRDHYGCGYILLSDALKRDSVFFVPGVIGELDQFYKKFAHHKVNAVWHRKISLSDPLNTIKRLLKIPVSKKLIKKYIKNVNRKNIDLLLEPNSIFDTLIKKDFKRIEGYRVTENFLKWRVFLNESDSISRIVLHDGEGFIALALGLRKGFPICRIIYSSMYSQKSSDLLLDAACHLSKKLGFPIILHASDCNFSNESCARKKFTEIKDSPNVYFCSKSKDNVYSKHWGLIGDYGFDEFTFSRN